MSKPFTIYEANDRGINDRWLYELDKLDTLLKKRYSPKIKE